MPALAVFDVLPPRLDALLAVLISPVKEQVIVARGFAAGCALNEHLMARWVSGRYRPTLKPEIAAAFPGVPAPVLDLVLYMCTNCEGLEVRDRTFDSITDFDGNGLRKVIASGRRDGFLGWYSGARANQRQYFGGSHHA